MKIPKPLTHVMSFFFFFRLIFILGTVGVQIAKALGAYVVGVCSTDNVELVKSLGADEVVDYKKEDVTEKYTHQDFDLVFDTVGSAAEVIHSFFFTVLFIVIWCNNGVCLGYLC